MMSARQSFFSQANTAICISASNIIGADALTGSNLRLRFTFVHEYGVFFILRMLLLLGEVKCMGVQQGI
jgi:hypothetical protein